MIESEGFNFEITVTLRGTKSHVYVCIQVYKNRKNWATLVWYSRVKLPDFVRSDYSPRHKGKGVHLITPHTTKRKGKVFVTCPLLGEVATGGGEVGGGEVGEGEVDETRLLPDFILAKNLSSFDHCR